MIPACGAERGLEHLCTQGKEELVSPEPPPQATQAKDRLRAVGSNGNLESGASKHRGEGKEQGAGSSELAEREEAPVERLRLILCPPPLWSSTYFTRAGSSGLKEM